MQEFYYCDDAANPYGPYSAVEMGELWRHNIITPLTHVWREGDKVRQEFRRLPEYKKIRDASFTRQIKAENIPDHWVAWCKTGNYGIERKTNAVKRCLQDGQVRGYLSDIPLNPNIDKDHPMYPSFEHLTDPTNHNDGVVEARVFNYMKSNLSEDEFWRVIEHLFIVGVEKAKILPPYGKRLPKKWRSKRDYKKVELQKVPEPIEKITVVVAAKTMPRGSRKKSK